METKQRGRRCRRFHHLYHPSICVTSTDLGRFRLSGRFGPSDWLKESLEDLMLRFLRRRKPAQVHGLPNKQKQNLTSRKEQQSWYQLPPHSVLKVWKELGSNDLIQRRLIFHWAASNVTCLYSYQWSSYEQGMICSESGVEYRYYRDPDTNDSPSEWQMSDGTRRNISLLSDLSDCTEIPAI